ncbi:hypothetical protein [Amylibacter sp. SFDW26]|uniref:hypothetical protein n=1 Tax=Amylibacter sp. SFDW26 TaxID=2652722 RepID=UPI00186A2BEE|nr:hypothetical protein [Amylibacter sp. SFDW26]
MLSIISDAMMIATRTSSPKRPFEDREENRRYLYLEDRRRREEKRQLNLALGRGLLK